MKETYQSSQEYYNALVSAQPREKPTVRYFALIDSVPLCVGYEASVVPVDHPASYLNGQITHTSPVVTIFEGGFETRNTRYVLVNN